MNPITELAMFLDSGRFDSFAHPISWIKYRLKVRSGGRKLEEMRNDEASLDEMVAEYNGISEELRPYEEAYVYGSESRDQELHPHLPSPVLLNALSEEDQSRAFSDAYVRNSQHGPTRRSRHVNGFRLDLIDIIHERGEELEYTRSDVYELLKLTRAA